MTDRPTFAPLVKQVLVRADVDRAFARFTAGLGDWWPRASHSVGGVESLSVTFEGHVGGRIVESIRDGRVCVWGTVTAWEPPRRVAFTWHPGREPETAQDVEVRFEPHADGTRVVLVHTGFERLGAKLGRVARRGYPLGWTYVLGLYAERRGPAMALLRGVTDLLVGRQRRRANRRR